MNDKAFAALMNEHRRKLLVALLGENPSVARFKTPTSSDSEAVDPDRLQVAMHHHHLPKLVDSGFVHVDEDTNEISKGPQFEEIRPLLELVEGHTES